MALIDEIKEKIATGQFEFTKHAADQSIIRHIAVSEVREALLSDSVVIEDYPEDKYGPSCLILGFTKSGRPLHVQSSYPSRTVLKIITIYEPEEGQWLDHRIRRR